MMMCAEKIVSTSQRDGHPLPARARTVLGIVFFKSFRMRANCFTVANFSRVRFAFVWRLW